MTTFSVNKKHFLIEFLVVMAYVSDVTNSMGVEEKKTPHAPEADSFIDKISRDVETESTIQPENDSMLFHEKHKETSKLPNHLFDSGEARDREYDNIKKTYAKLPRQYTRSGSTYDTFPDPHFYFQTQVSGFDPAKDGDIGSAVKIPPVVQLGSYHPQEWECGCLKL